MSTPRRRERSEEVREANLIPVLSCMFLLIPALLLAMEVASMSSIHVRPPQFVPEPSAQAPTDPQRVRFSVHIRADGFEAGADVDGAPGIRSIPIASDAVGDDPYDYEALRAHAREIKRLFPETSIVTLSAEGDIPLQTLVKTMDAVRGETCSLAEVHAGETPDDDCLFYQVVVSA